MGVTTTADEKRRNAKDLIGEAYRELLVFLDEQTWGHDSYDDEYINKVHEITMELLKMKREL